jgi:hypothetical protein
MVCPCYSLCVTSFFSHTRKMPSSHVSFQSILFFFSAQVRGLSHGVPCYSFYLGPPLSVHENALSVLLELLYWCNVAFINSRLDWWHSEFGEGGHYMPLQKYCGIVACYKVFEFYFVLVSKQWRTYNRVMLYCPWTVWLPWYTVFVSIPFHVYYFFYVGYTSELDSRGTLYSQSLCFVETTFFKCSVSVVMQLSTMLYGCGWRRMVSVLPNPRCRKTSCKSRPS